MKIQLLIFSIFILFTTHICAQALQLVKDINTVTPGSSASAAVPFTAYNNELYFSPNTGPQNIGLCKTNGTPAGTVVVKTMIQSIQSITAATNKIFFFSNGTSTNIGFWVSDGTEAGTVQIKTLTSGIATSVSLIKYVGSLLYFTHNNKLWRSDGTDAGTFELATFNSAVGTANSITSLTDVNGTLFFRGNTIANGYELWKSDGTLSGTVMVKDILVGTGNGNPLILGVIGNTLVFTANDGTTGQELWKTDGTEANTVRIIDLNSGISNTSINSAATVGNTIYFAASVCNPTCTAGEELYKTDGTEAGTILVKDINPGAANATPRLLTNVNGTLFFSASNGSAGTLLWKSDGTETGTVIVKNILEGFTTATFTSFTPDSDNNRLLFRASTDGNLFVWKSDGTTQGTQIIPITGTISANPNASNVTIAGNRIFFTATSASTTGTELYCTNADASTAALANDINPGTASSGISTMAALSNQVVFFANSLQYGIEPWKSDGTETGTLLLKDLNAFSNSSSPANLIDINGTLFFSAADGDVNNNELWKSDGTSGGTVLVKDIWPGLSGSNPASFCAINGLLYFTARNTLNNTELWRSDGTNGGTFMVKDIIPGETSGSSPVKLTAMNGILYFIANDPDFGTELFRSDGTSDGTYMVKDIRPGNATISAGNTQIFAMGNTLFFGFSDGTIGTELWKSDGTTDGTVLVKDINPGSGSSSPSEFYLVNGILYFRATNGANGIELWKTDGTDAGTVMVKDLSPGSGNGSPQQFVAYENSLVFWGPGGLWKSDGTDAGTLKMVDVTGNIASLVNAGGTLFFAAGPNTILTKSDLTQLGTKSILNSSAGQGVNSAVPMTNTSQIFAVGNTVYLRSAAAIAGLTTNSGFELWKCVNSADTGILIADIYAGNQSSNPGNFSLANGNLFFSATTPEKGTELYKITVSAGIPLTSTWTGAVSTAWEDAANWSNGVPGAITAVIIPAGMPRYPIINANTSVKSISIADGASVNTSTNVIVTISGN